MLFSLPEIVPDKKIRVDFDSPDISSNGGLVLIGNSVLLSMVDKPRRRAENSFVTRRTSQG